jgi:hypothetical protein
MEFSDDEDDLMDDQPMEDRLHLESAVNRYYLVPINQYDPVPRNFFDDAFPPNFFNDPVPRHGLTLQEHRRIERAKKKRDYEAKRRIKKKDDPEYMKREIANRKIREKRRQEKMKTDPEYRTRRRLQTSNYKKQHKANNRKQ